LLHSRAGKVKANFAIFNWPWITDEQPSGDYGNTYLQFFFETKSHLDTTGNIQAYDDDKYMRYIAKSERSLLKVDFLKVYTTDGVDHFSHWNDFLIGINITSQFFDFPACIAICQGNGAIVPRWTQLNYDPNLNALFSPPVTPETPTTTPAKRTLNPAAYVVPVVLAVIVIAAVGVYLFVIKPKKTTRGIPANSSL
jgi:hypothetical protein